MTPALVHRVATSSDIPSLARMNQPLIDDEGRRNSMNKTQLESRMRSILDGDYTVTLSELHGLNVAYALWREEPEWVYLLRDGSIRPIPASVACREMGHLGSSQRW